MPNIYFSMCFMSIFFCFALAPLHQKRSQRFFKFAKCENIMIYPDKLHLITIFLMLAPRRGALLSYSYQQFLSAMLFTIIIYLLRLRVSCFHFALGSSQVIFLLREYVILLRIYYNTLPRFGLSFVTSDYKCFISHNSLNL